jgi:lysophospholipase L1-like esterase
MTRLLAVVAAALVLTIGGAAPAIGRTDAPGRFDSPVYLALGDSVAAGVGAEPHVTGYPEQAGALLAHGYNPAANKATPNAAVEFETTNIAAGGVTTATMAGQLKAALDLIGDRQHDRDPFNNVEVVSVTIGGNDIFNAAVNSCILAATAACQPTIDAVLAAVRTNLTSILGQLTAAAGRGTEVVITTYYNPIGSCFLAQLNPAAPQIAGVVLEGGHVPGLLTLQDGLNDVIRAAAAATGAQVADLYGELGPAQFVGGSDCLHPNLSGHTTIAGIVYDTLAR